MNRREAPQDQRHINYTFLKHQAFKVTANAVRGSTGPKDRSGRIDAYDAYDTVIVTRYIRVFASFSRVAPRIPIPFFAFGVHETCRFQPNSLCTRQQSARFRLNFQTRPTGERFSARICSRRVRERALPRLVKAAPA